MNMVEIVLINPRFEMSYWGMEHALHLCAKFGKRANMPVSALPLLAALTSAEHKITLIDENVEEIDFALCAKADIVGRWRFTCVNHSKEPSFWAFSHFCSWFPR
jgi:hypothetical protein